MFTRRIGVLTSGGDCPGLNAVLRGVTKAAEKLDWQVIGFRDGFEGLLPPSQFVILDRATTAGIMQQGGTILGGVPKTIDNDIEATAMTFGFYSAVSCVTDALDRLHSTAASHKRAMVLEVMGRHAGWIALHGGISGGADVILIPEIPFEWEKVAQAVRQRDAEGYPSTMIVVAEGARPRDGMQHYQQIHRGEYRLGGIGEIVAREVAERTGKETRYCILGHLQRGGAPGPLDRILARRRQFRPDGELPALRNPGRLDRRGGSSTSRR